MEILDWIAACDRELARVRVLVVELERRGAAGRARAAAMQITIDRAEAAIMAQDVDGMIAALAALVTCV